MRELGSFIGMGALALACSAGENDGGSITCSSQDRTGTYLQHFDTVSGDCGDIPDAVGRLENAAQELPAGCAFDAPDRWTEADCKLERAFTCDEPTIGAGVTSKNVAVTTQNSDDGARISGTVTMRILEASGVQLCIGTYRVTASRQ